MFDFSWGEILIIGAVALIVIGPKELPTALRTVGRMVGKVKRMASEFQGQFNEALREADLDKVRKDVEGMNRAASGGFNPVKTIRDEMKSAIDRPGVAAAASASSASSAAAFAGTKVGAAATGVASVASTGGEASSQTAAAPIVASTHPKAETSAEVRASASADPVPAAAGDPANPDAVTLNKSAEAGRMKEEKQT